MHLSGKPLEPHKKLFTIFELSERMTQSDPNFVERINKINYHNRSSQRGSRLLGSQILIRGPIKSRKFNYCYNAPLHKILKKMKILTLRIHPRHSLQLAGIATRVILVPSSSLLMGDIKASYGLRPCCNFHCSESMSNFAS